jgi:hypothetical protein
MQLKGFGLQGPLVPAQDIEPTPPVKGSTSQAARYINYAHLFETAVDNRRQFFPKFVYGLAGYGRAVATRSLALSFMWRAITVLNPP